MIFKQRNKSGGFYMACLVYYGVLTLYFFGVRFVLDESNVLGEIWEYLLGFVILAATAILAMRIDLLWLSYGAHLKMFGGVNKEPPRSKGQFFARVLAYYAFVIVVGVALFVLRDDVYFLLFYYMVFLAGSIAMTYFDYLFPSYERYRRNVEAGQWGLSRFSRA